MLQKRLKHSMQPECGWNAFNRINNNGYRCGVKKPIRTENCALLDGEKSNALNIQYGYVAFAVVVCTYFFLTLVCLCFIFNSCCFC